MKHLKRLLVVLMLIDSPSYAAGFIDGLTTNVFGLQRQSSAPSSPASGLVKEYVLNSDGKLYIKDSAGTAKACIFSGDAVNADLSGSAGITNANLASMGNATFKCRTTAGTGAPENCTAAQSTALLNAMVGDSGSGGTKGLVPAPASGDAAAGKVLSAGGTWTVGGTITSAALSMPAIFSVGGSPITSSGTFAVTLATQSANLVWAGPSSGSAATPTFRLLVGDDLPAPTASKFGGIISDSCSTGAMVHSISTAGTINCSTQYNAIDGTAGAPGFSFFSDTTSGLYHSGTTQISLATNSTERIRINSDGTLRFLAYGAGAPMFDSSGNITSSKVTLTAPASGSTLTIANGKTLTASNTLTMVGADGSTLTFGTGGTVTYTANKLSVFAATSSSELAGVISDETGSGLLVFSTSPSLTTPSLGVATATSVNGMGLSCSATTCSEQITSGKSVVFSNTLSFSGTDSSSIAFGTGGTVAYTANKLSVFAATSSSELAGVISDETGSGLLVFGTSPTLVTPTFLKVANLTSNGFVKTSGSDGTLGIQASPIPSADINAGRTINAQTGTTYTFVLADGAAAGGHPLVTSSNASAQTYTVPTNASVAYPTGDQIDVCQIGAGKLTLAGAGGVTVSSKGSNLSASAQYVCLTLVKTGTNTWLLLGDMIAGILSLLGLSVYA